MSLIDSIIEDSKRVADTVSNAMANKTEERKSYYSMLQDLVPDVVEAMKSVEDSNPILKRIKAIRSIKDKVEGMFDHALIETIFRPSKRFDYDEYSIMNLHETVEGRLSFAILFNLLDGKTCQVNGRTVENAIIKGDKLVQASLAFDKSTQSFTGQPMIMTKLLPKSNVHCEF